MKSPLKDKPLRNPGQSIDNEITNFIYDALFKYYVIAAMSIVFAVAEWVRWYYKDPPAPVFFTVVALIAVVYATINLIRAKSKIKSLKQGRDGEKAVAQYLDRLREQGAQLIHDIPSKGFNLDHVVVSKSGVYVIETKTYSKPDKGEAKIIFNGESVLINGNIETAKPIIQAKAAAGWLSEMLFESTGKKFITKPVVLFPGWFIEPTSEAKSSDVWVLNPKALPAFIGNSNEQLKREEIKMVSFHISRYIRSYTELK